jgi:RNA recognition motif-containing protein
VSVKEQDKAGLKLRGLPFQIKPSDILYFFSDFRVISSSVQIDKNLEGKRTGYGSILFQSEEECRRALNEKQGGHMGNRYIELYLISVGEYLEKG